jgi:hypothetical protein
MDKSEIIKGLEIERECISRTCDRDCANCDLVVETEWLFQVYDGALALLKAIDEDRDDSTRWKESWTK